MRSTTTTSCRVVASKSFPTRTPGLVPDLEADPETSAAAVATAPSLDLVQNLDPSLDPAPILDPSLDLTPNLMLLLAATNDLRPGLDPDPELPRTSLRR